MAIQKDIESTKEAAFNFAIIPKLPKGVYFVEMKVNGNVKAITRLIKIGEK